MKKIFATILLITLLCSFTYSLSEGLATPTDLIVSDTSEGIHEELYLIPEDNHHLEIEITKHPEFLGDTVTFELFLIDYAPGEIVDIEWQYSEDNETWFTIEGEHELTYTCVVDRTNYKYWWRGIVTYRYDSD